MPRKRTLEELAYHREYMKKYRQANKAKALESEKNTRARRTPEQREKYLAYMRDYHKGIRRPRVLEGDRTAPDIEYVEQQREYMRQKFRDVADEVIAHYGGKCACCGETERLFLSIDHINNDGAKHRREVPASSLYRWLKKNGYPEGFQVLCMNCNCGKARNGGVCPHQHPSR
jgi:hypothetical protein